MKNILVISLCFFISSARAGHYYFSSISGNDLRSVFQARDSSTPWKTLAKLNAVFPALKPGDTIFFKRGEIFSGAISVGNSGTAERPIVLTAYGSGGRPVISGFTLLSQWVSSGNKIFECNSPYFLTTLNMLLINGQPKAIGRYPNAGQPNKGYLTFEHATGNTQIKDDQLSSSPNWTGGEVIIRKNRWVIDRNLIRQHSGNTIDYISGSRYSADANFGYFIQNHLKTLDLDGEWCYNAGSKKLSVLFNAGPAASSVKASTVDTLIKINGRSSIVFSNINFEGANQHAFTLTNCNQVRISNCNISFSGLNAVNASKCTGITIENSLLYYSNNIAINLSGCAYTSIKNNQVKRTGVNAGMGSNESGSYEAILMDGDHNTIQLNQIDSTGYIPITFSGNAVAITHNVINYFAFVKDDGGGIYTYNGSATPAVNYDRRITGNIILNGVGAGNGTSDTLSLSANGIYIDDKVGDVRVQNNTVSGCAKYGIFIHNANTINITGNTVFNNGQQLVLIHDNIAPDNPVRNINMVNNILFSKKESSLVAAYKTIGNDLKDMGRFDSNYYCRPLDDKIVISIGYKNGSSHSKLLDLESWKALYAKDIASKTSPFAIMGYTIKKLNGSNKFTNGSFNSNIAGLYAWSAAGNCTASWNNGALDNGGLQISFSKLTGTQSPASVVIGVGALSANKNYILRFSLKGTHDHKSLQTFLRKSLADYNDLSDRKDIMITASRTEQEILFKAQNTQSSASIVFDIVEQEKPLYLDNIQLYEADISLNDIDKLIRFEYNPTSVTKRILLDGSYADVKNKIYTGSLLLAPFSSVILLNKSQDIKYTRRLPREGTTASFAKINSPIPQK